MPRALVLGTGTFLIVGLLGVAPASAQVAPPGGYGPSAPSGSSNLGLTGPVAVSAVVGAEGATLTAAPEDGLQATLVLAPGVLTGPAQVTLRDLPPEAAEGGSGAAFVAGWLVVVTETDGSTYVAASSAVTGTGGRLAGAAVGASAASSTLPPGMQLTVRGERLGRSGQAVTVRTAGGSTDATSALSPGLLSVPIRETPTAVTVTGPAAAGAAVTPAAPSVTRPGAAGTAAELPFTGANVKGAGIGGLVWILVGGLLLRSGRRRQPVAVPA
jgi:hypothetical protein